MSPKPVTTKSAVCVFAATLSTVASATLWMFYPAHTVFAKARQTQSTSGHSAKDVRFHPSAWRGMGNIAFIRTDDAFGYAGELYTLVNRKVSGHMTVESHKLLDRVFAAKFSPNGRWLAVWAQNPKPADTSSSTSLWLMASDGSVRQRLLSGAQRPLVANWSSKGVLIYGEGANLFTKVPLQDAHRLPAGLPQDATLQDLQVSPSGQTLALNVTFSAHISKQPWVRYDKIGLLQLGSAEFHPIITTKPPNGLVLGPWSADGRALFYWPDPDHSASILADGTTLTQVSLTGKTLPIGVTLTADDCVIPTVGRTAIIQSGGGRSLSMSKSVASWTGKRLKVFQHPKDTVGIEPDVSSDHRWVAYMQGPVQNVDSGSAEVNWRLHLQLVVASVTTGKQRIIALPREKNGQGWVFSGWKPLLDAHGQHVLLTQPGRLVSVSVNGNHRPAPVATMTATNRATQFRVLSYQPN